MTFEELKKISEEEWSLASLAVLRFLKKRSGLTPERMVSEGKTIEDIVCESIMDLITGKREFNPEKSLLDNLRLIAMSKFNWLFSSSDYRKRILGDPSDEEHEMIVNEDHCQMDPYHSIDYDFFLQELKKEIAEDEELGLVLMAIEDDGEKKSAKIGEITGIDVKRVYELRRKLGDKAQKVQRRILSNKTLMSQVDK